MKRTYITVQGIVKEYDYPKYIRKKKRPHCPKCTNELRAIYWNSGPSGERRYDKIGYYCGVCRFMYMDGSKGIILRCKIE